ncbi:MAG: nucleotidyltransferase family protein [Gammaproteobacteria bacterium]|nr:nucleotidyltransferase family protein [Gammaproteobacteria bacterium]MDH5591490.1 nucleotidyltransferase family protein [Gammaproteobacteria bacterium]
MKVIILAAGRGERLRPLTDHTPKPLLKAGNYRLIEYTIRSLVKAGFDDIVINYAHLGEQFPEILGNGHQYGASIVYSPEHEGGLETAGGIINALPLLDNEPFLVVNGDIWTDYPFERLTHITLATNMLCYLVMVNNPQHNSQGDFSLSSGLIQQSGDDQYTYSGIGIYHPDLFSGLNVQRMPLRPLLLQAIYNQQVGGEIYQGEWSDIGTVERLQKLIRTLNH